MSDQLKELRKISRDVTVSQTSRGSIVHIVNGSRRISSPSETLIIPLEVWAEIVTGVDKLQDAIKFAQRSHSSDGNKTFKISTKDFHATLSSWSVDVRETIIKLIINKI